MTVTEFLESETLHKEFVKYVYRTIEDASKLLDTARFFVKLYDERFPHEKGSLIDAMAKR